MYGCMYGKRGSVVGKKVQTHTNLRAACAMSKGSCCDTLSCWMGSQAGYVALSE